MMNQKQAGRLLTLAYYLKTEVPTKRLKQDYWGYSTCKSNLNKIGSLDSVCGTSGCALGWATNIWPRNLRLTFNDLDYLNYSEGELLPFATVEFCMNSGQWVESDIFTNQILIEDFFGLTRSELDEVFGAEKMTPKQKAKQIENLVKKHGWVYA
jgi:hypothetical protein